MFVRVIIVFQKEGREVGTIVASNNSSNNLYLDKFCNGTRQGVERTHIDHCKMWVCCESKCVRKMYCESRCGECVREEKDRDVRRRCYQARGLENCRRGGEQGWV